MMRRGSGFKATTQYAKVADMDVVIICVPTPLNEYREPDMSYIENTAKAIAPPITPLRMRAVFSDEALSVAPRSGIAPPPNPINSLGLLLFL